jgi:hypothetical protein
MEKDPKARPGPKFRVLYVEERTIGGKPFIIGWRKSGHPEQLACDLYLGYGDPPVIDRNELRRVENRKTALSAIRDILSGKKPNTK